MKKINIGILGILGIILLVVSASGCTSAGNNTTQSNQSNNQQNAQQSSSNTATIKIIATGPWTGNIQDSSGSRSIQGSGTQTFNLASSSGTVGASIQKDNSKNAVNNGTITQDTSTLTVQLLSNGNVLESQSTSADAGVVTITHTF